MIMKTDVAGRRLTKYNNYSNTKKAAKDRNI